MKKILSCLIFLCLYSISKGEYKEYDLINGKLLKDSNLTKVSEFKLYVKAFQFQNVNFTFNIGGSNDIIKEVVFYEYTKRYDQYAISEKKQLVNSYFGSGWLFSLPYIVTEPSTNYIAIKLVLNQKPIYYLNVIAEVTNGIYDLIKGKSENIEEEESFNLIDGVSKNISNLKKGIIYNFMIENIRKLDTAKIKITLDNFYKEALTKIDIIESHYGKTYLNSESQSISFSNQNKKLVSTNSYTISNDLTSVLLLKITLNCDIEIFNILIEIQKGEFDILRDKEKCINLKAKQKYHFYRPSFKHKSYDYTLTVNYMRNQPFKFINIYECRPFFTDCSSKKYQEIEFKLKREN